MDPSSLLDPRLARESPLRPPPRPSLHRDYPAVKLPVARGARNLREGSGGRPRAAGAAAQQAGVLPIQDSPAQRRIELRAILQSQQNALEQPATERRLSPEERAELREQVRQQYQGRPHNTGRP